MRNRGLETVLGPAIGYKAALACDCEEKWRNREEYPVANTPPGITALILRVWLLAVTYRAKNSL